MTTPQCICVVVFRLVRILQRTSTSPLLPAEVNESNPSAKSSVPVVVSRK